MYSYMYCTTVLDMPNGMLLIYLMKSAIRMKRNEKIYYCTLYFTKFINYINLILPADSL